MTDWTVEEWRAWRLEGLGGSDIAAASTGRYGGAYRVVAERLGDPIPASERINPTVAARGHRWEPTIAALFQAARPGVVVYDAQRALQHPDNPRHRVTPDGLVGPLWAKSPRDLSTYFEGKTRDRFGPWPWDYWLDQVQWGLHVSGLRRAVLAVATIATDVDVRTGASDERLTDLKLRDIDRDDERIGQLVALADDLLAMVDEGRTPPISSAGALPYVKARNARQTGGKTVTLPADWVDLLNERERLSAEVRDAEARLDLVEAQLRDAVGDAASAATPEDLPEVWRVNVGVPRRVFTRRSAGHVADLVGREQDRRDGYTDVDEASIPEALRSLSRDDLDRLIAPALDESAALDLIPDVLDDARESTPTRSLTTKRLRGPEHD